jgi:hypothetical protein
MLEEVTQMQRRTEATKVPVEQRALLQRINRKLAHEGEVVKKARQGRRFRELGEFYVIDVRRNCVTAKDVDLEAWGHKHGVLAPFEVLIK